MRRWLIATCLTAAAATAYADDRAVAKQLYDDGLRHYNVAEYPAAIVAWKQAYLLSKKPILLFNIGQAYRLAGDCKQALTFYGNYEREEPHPQNQDELDQALVLCKEAGATLDKPVPVPDKPIDQPADKPTDKPVDKPAPMPDQPSAAPVSIVAATEPSSPRRTVAYIAGGVGLASGITGIVFALDARAQDHKNADVTSWTVDNNAIQARGERDDKLALVFGAVGVAGIATGIVLYMTGRGDAEHGVAIAPTRGGLSVAWAHGF